MSIYPNGGSFSAMLRSFSLQSRKYCRVKSPCLAKNFLAIGHISNFQTRLRLGLQWPDIDFEHKTLQVKRQLLYLGGGGKGYQYATPKSNKPRLIVLPDLALQALLQQKKQQTEMRLMVGAAWENSDDLVFTDELGRHLKHDVVYRNLKRIFQCMGVPDLRFHDLRHSYAVLSLQSGCDIKTMQENLGHYAAAFTLDTYGHVTEQMRRDGAEKINNFIESMEKKMG